MSRYEGSRLTLVLSTRAEEHRAKRRDDRRVRLSAGLGLLLEFRKVKQLLAYRAEIGGCLVNVLAMSVVASAVRGLITKLFKSWECLLCISSDIPGGLLYGTVNQVLKEKKVSCGGIFDLCVQFVMLKRFDNVAFQAAGASHHRTGIEPALLVTTANLGSTHALYSHEYFARARAEEFAEFLVLVPSDGGT